MKSRKTAARIGLLFVGAVIIPAGILAVLAIRAIDREKVYVEKQLQQTLSTELIHVASLVGAELDEICDELDRSAPSLAGADPGSLLETWKNGATLIRTPFLLNPDFEILWPRLSSAASPDQFEFLQSNQEFITNKAETPVYANIALAYQDEIAGMVQPAPGDRLGMTSVLSRRAEPESSPLKGDLQKKPSPRPNRQRRGRLANGRHENSGGRGERQKSRRKPYSGPGTEAESDQGFRRKSRGPAEGLSTSQGTGAAIRDAQRRSLRQRPS